MPTSSRESESEPLTLGQALAAHVRLIVWCKSCNHRAEPDIATQVAQHGSSMPVPDWARLLRCTECGERDGDFGMHFDRALDARVMRHFDVGIAAADMGEHDAILV